VLKFFRWMLIPLLLLDALAINGFLRYGLPVQSEPVELRHPIKSGEAVMQFQRIPPSRQDCVIASILMALHLVILWAHWVQRRTSVPRIS